MKTQLTEKPFNVYFQKKNKMLKTDGYKTSEVARRYFEKKGESLTKAEALNRFRFVRNKDKILIISVLRDLYDEEIKNLAD